MIMKNRNFRTGQYEHEWGFMANDVKGGKRGDLLQCTHEGCRVWSWMGDKPYFKMTHDEFVAMHERGEINATETLGLRTGEKKPYAAYEKYLKAGGQLTLDEWMAHPKK